ncbi:MAG: putative tryptophan/tyrosine transport system permease protein [Thermoanaerobaculia bacterium]|jgi:putative ABC transport system permease protein|nr:putative tryptophan/tyrosine transport system permease protein [Thermoanaerobaculia bacterium]
MTLLVSAWTIGLILSLLALGVYISYRVFAFPDITADGSITFGAAVAASMLTRGMHPLAASAAAFLAGSIAGACTGILHTRFKINQLLSGILVMTALYSINLHVMGQSNLPLLSTRTLTTYATSLGQRLCGSDTAMLLGWPVSARELGSLILSAAVVLFVAIVAYLFFRTNLGSAMRASGDNAQMIRALGVSVENMIILGLAVSNGLVAFAGALLAQYQGFADVQMGIGMVVWGLASVIIGRALVGSDSLGSALTGTIIGSVLFRLIIAVALRWGLNPNDLKLVTAIFVFGALVLPLVMQRWNAQRSKSA